MLGGDGGKGDEGRKGGGEDTKGGRERGGNKGKEYEGREGGFKTMRVMDQRV